MSKFMTTINGLIAEKIEERLKFNQACLEIAESEFNRAVISLGVDNEEVLIRATWKANLESSRELLGSVARQNDIGTRVNLTAYDWINFRSELCGTFDDTQRSRVERFVDQKIKEA